VTGGQRDFFREIERDYWADAEGLKDEETALIARYLDPAEPTLDAGTGGGRIARALAERGFGRVTGFDFAPELIDAARESDPTGAIAFDVADATELPYGDAAFGQAVYLQQVICTIDDAAGRKAALAEAVRVLRPGGVALFSFVCLESRLASPAQRAYVGYLRAARAVRRSRRPIQSMPRLRLRGRLDASALRDAGPYNWWYRSGEAEQDLVGAGFAIEAIGFGEGLVATPGGTLYAVARKPG
jgi:ubiquinone/menaquinone biosynthesis C-methylase UbiE